MTGIAARLRIAFAVVAIGAATLLMLPVQLVAMRTGFPSERHVPRLWHGLARRLLGFRVTLSGRPATERPLLIVANHVSWSDIVLFGATSDVNFIARSDMAGWPVFGMLAKLHRSIFVEREKRRSSGEQTRAVATRLTGGDAIVLFAEGTTSDGNVLLPFKSTLFGAVGEAMRAGGAGTVYVQPAAIAYLRHRGLPMGRSQKRRVAWVGDEALLPHIGWLLTNPGIDAEIAFGEPVAVTLPFDRKALARDTEAAVRALLDRMRRGG